MRRLSWVGVGRGAWGSCSWDGGEGEDEGCACARVCVHCEVGMWIAEIRDSEGGISVGRRVGVRSPGFGYGTYSAGAGILGYVDCILGPVDIFRMARFFVASLLLSGALAANFDFENVLLKAEETVDYPAIRFRNSSNLPPAQECRSTPGDESWPSDADWALFNKTLGGVLLKPVPLAASCYEGNLYNSTTCASLRRGWTSMGQQWVLQRFRVYIYIWY